MLLVRAAYDLDPLVGYIRQQRAHHRAHAGLEPWQLAPP
jgi:hypothetical protein